MIPLATVRSAAEQGSPEWLAERVGMITGSDFSMAREWVVDVPGTKGKVDKKTGAVIEPPREATYKRSSRAMLYAMNKARERAGGTVLSGYQNAAMRLGKEYEAPLISAYEIERGVYVERVGLCHTPDRKFGFSPDGLVGDDGLIEVKSLVGSDTLFKVLVNQDYSEYLDQIRGGMLLLGRQWCDLLLGVPDLREAPFVVRIERKEVEMEELATDLLQMDALVDLLRSQLVNRITT